MSDEAVVECQDACKKDPTCPGIVMQRYGDGSINCMVYRKNSGQDYPSLNDLCVYPPFETDDYKCVHDLGNGDHPGMYWRGTRTTSSDPGVYFAKKAAAEKAAAEKYAASFASKKAENGYWNNGEGVCRSGQFFGSHGWALLNPGEPKKVAANFDDPLYKEYTKRGQAKCDADPKCNHVSVWRNAGYRMYNTDNCSDRVEKNGQVRSWKKYVDPAEAAAALAAKMATSPDSTKESTNPEMFTSSAPFKPLGEWRLDNPATGYEHNQFKTKSKVSSEAVVECQAACKQDPTCPGISMDRHGDGSIYCMKYRKQSGNASNDLCVYPPFETDDYKCVRGVGEDSPGTYWRGTRTTSTASIDAGKKAFAELELSILGKPDSVRESTIPEKFTSSAPFKPLGKWRLSGSSTGYPYSQFKTKMQVEELAVEECQAACKKDPTCPGISMQRYGDGSINCMVYKKQSGNVSNELCVYPPFETDARVEKDALKCVHDLSENSPGTYWRGTRTTSDETVKAIADKIAAEKAAIAETIGGYSDNGNGYCKSGEIFSSDAWALLTPEERKALDHEIANSPPGSNIGPRWPGYREGSSRFNEYSKRAQAKCDAEPKCTHVTVWDNAGYRLYNSKNCTEGTKRTELVSRVTRNGGQTWEVPSEGDLQRVRNLTGGSACLANPNASICGGVIKMNKDFWDNPDKENFVRNVTKSWKKYGKGNLAPYRNENHRIASLKQKRIESGGGTFAENQAIICREDQSGVTGRGGGGLNQNKQKMTPNWTVFGKCQPDPNDPTKGRKLLQKAYIDHDGKVTGVRGKCALFRKFEECSSDCEFKSSKSLLSPSSWFGWVEGKNKDAGLLVSRHKVVYPAVGKSVKSCCRQLGCPDDCIDPPPGEYIHKDQGVVIDTDKMKHFTWNDKCDAWGSGCILEKSVWNTFKGKFNKKAEMKKKYGAKFPQQGGACASPTQARGAYAKDEGSLYYYHL